MKLSKIFYFIAFLILVILVHPLYLKQSVYKWLYESCTKNETANVVIYNLDNNNVVISDNSGNLQIDYTKDCYPGNSKSCAKIKLPVTNSWKDFNFSFKAESNGKSFIRFSGSNEREDYGVYPVLADFSKISVNNYPLILTEKTLWSDYFLDSPVYNLENGKVFTVSVSARKHHLKFSDFILLLNTYSDWKISSVWNLVGTIFVIIIFLSLIYFKKFKYLFCFMTFLFLVSPFLFISHNNISKQENRALKKFPSLFIKGKINEKFGIDFDNWYSDRFGGRQILINSRFYLLYKINKKISNEDVFIADDDWRFPTKGIKKILTPNEQRERNFKVINLLKKVNKSMKGKDVRFYVVLEPSRSVLYKKYWEKYYPYIPYYDYIGEMKKELKEYSNIHLIDLNDAFEKNKDNVLLFEKNDPHMTLPAVNIMLESIISEIGDNLEEHYKKSIMYKERDCKLYSFLNYYDYLLNIETIEPETLPTCKEITITPNNMKILYEEVGLREATVSKPYINRDLFILFPCYEEFLFPVLGQFFAHTTSVNYNPFDDHDEEQLRNKALAKLKSVKPGTVVLIFISYPTEFNLSKSINYLEEF